MGRISLYGGGDHLRESRNKASRSGAFVLKLERANKRGGKMKTPIRGGGGGLGNRNLKILRGGITDMPKGADNIKGEKSNLISKRGGQQRERKDEEEKQSLGEGRIVSSLKQRG